MNPTPEREKEWGWYEGAGTYYHGRWYSWEEWDQKCAEEKAAAEAARAAERAKPLSPREQARVDAFNRRVDESMEREKIREASRAAALAKTTPDQRDAAAVRTHKQYSARVFGPHAPWARRIKKVRTGGS